MSEDDETLRWPTNLDRDAIVERLVQVRAMAEAAGLTDVAERFRDVETMASGLIGARVVTTLTWVQEKPEYGSISSQLAMVAMNLKNLK